ncbi:MAG: exosortase/archaeosortase family protein [Phycisphaerae bacterium]|nr:exosortase/archaeosortase family protein [Phycisphaerae bacterium]
MQQNTRHTNRKQPHPQPGQKAGRGVAAQADLEGFSGQMLKTCGAMGFLFALFIWCHWQTARDIFGIWMRSDEYSCGLLVPFLVGYIAWSRREEIAQCIIKPSLWGVPLFIAAQAMRFFGLFFMYGSAERLSFVLSIGALLILLFGWRLFHKVWVIWFFLFLMLPLPNRVQSAIALPLQEIATTSAVFLLEVLGWEITRDGNIIHIGETSVAVAEACNGLRMVTSFFVISGLVVLLIKRTWWEKSLILLTTLPIGLLCNTIRLAVTAVAFTMIDSEEWELAFHDYGGFAMMPLALGIVVLELWFLKLLFVSPETVKDDQEDVLVVRSSSPETVKDDQEDVLVVRSSE